MSSQQSIRLLELIEFAQQSARLRSSPVADVSRHGIFHEFEHSIAGLPGLHFDLAQGDSGDEVWLVVDRLHESPAPQPESALLKTWLELTNNPAKEPNLRSHVEVQELLAIEPGHVLLRQPLPQTGWQQKYLVTIAFLNIVGHHSPPCLDACILSYLSQPAEGDLCNRFAQQAQQLPKNSLTSTICRTYYFKLKF